MDNAPDSFDTNIIVIGAGSGGLIAALIAAAVKARVTLIEKHQMGGDCLNTGCVPSKALIKSARFLHDVKHSSKYGIKTASAEFDFSDVMERVQDVIKKIEPHDSVERFTGLGVDCIMRPCLYFDVVPLIPRLPLAKTRAKIHEKRVFAAFQFG